VNKPVYKTDDEIELIRESSLLVGKTLAELASMIRPGITCLELDKRAEEFIKDHNAYPGFLGYTNAPLNEGDIVSVDIGVLKDGYWGDSAYTFPVGEVSPEVKKLLDVTKESLYLGIEQAIAGKRIGDIGHAVQSFAEANGYGVVRELVGHGVGKSLHEAPEVPNFGRRGTGMQMLEGLVIAIEPMINLGTKNVKQMKDGWTIQTADGKPSAHYEHTIVVRKNKAEILSTFELIEQALSLK